MSGLVAAACLRRYGACLRGASARVTRLLSSASTASVAPIVDDSLPEPSGHEQPSGASINANLPLLPKSKRNSIAFAQLLPHHLRPSHLRTPLQKVHPASGQRISSLGPVLTVLIESGNWVETVEILMAAPMAKADEIQILEKHFRLLKHPQQEMALTLLEYFVKKPGELGQNVLSADCANNDRVENILKAFRMMDKTLHVTSRTAFYRFLIGTFCNHGQVSEALVVLEEMCKRKMYLHHSIFTHILRSLAKKFLLDEAFETIAAMRRMKIRPGIEQYNIVIQACAMAGNMEKAYGVLAELQKHGEHSDVASFNHLIKGFCKQGVEAWEVSGMPVLVRYGTVTHPVNVLSLLLPLLSYQRRFKRARSVLLELKQAGMKPSMYTYSLLLHACAADRDFNAAMKLIKEMKDQGLATDALTAQVMDSFLVNSGNLDNALKVVEEMKIRGQHSGLVLKSQVLRRLAQAGRLEEASDVYQEIKLGAKSQIQASSATLLAACGTAGELDRMVQIFEESITQGSFDRSPEMYQPDYQTVSCIHMVLSFIRHNQLGRAAKFLQRISELGFTNDGVLLDKIFLHIASSGVGVNDGLTLLKAMRSLDIRPSRIGLEALLDCCTSEGDSAKALEIVQEMEAHSLPLNVFTKIRLLGIFVRARNEIESLKVLDGMSSDDLRDESVQFLVSRILELGSKGSRGVGVGPSLDALHKEVHRRRTVQ